jgi:hypothetical protein
MNQHECIKCRTRYSDDDVDAYLCATCAENKKKIAADIDAQFASRPHTEPMSELKLHEMNGKTVTIEGRQITFAKG